ncbi:FAD/NAD(P)-binding protein [Mesorhizobium sp. BAC0120]|uniref:FAD/NAD(P)-binding protein n=1 Tax=Mesorhizobium sp. BAC0120 TaxID=3090670 RepID=UPI00298BFC89|nr:FAD/NAD(P)-binding protein [Mesorhizobium sp. BAC0120]MDW6020634.1 FAD/NAD(P)-binding protein [Mesorhizobium sp. BAC0120]
MAAHLLRARVPGLEIIVVEKQSDLGRGLAYSTSLPDHLLNVRASNMSAFADDPDHFARWLAGRGINVADPSTYFAPRRLYGDYLGELLDGAPARVKRANRLSIVDDECVEIISHGPQLELRLAGGSSAVADRCILATGHDVKPYRGESLLAPRGAAQRMPSDPSDPVLIIGTGLSMIDTCLSLVLRGHVGPIFAVSRRGLLSTVHGRTTPIEIARADIPLGAGPREFVRWFRALVRSTETRGGDWRDVVDGLRPHNQSIWQSWSDSSKRQFFRHLKAWWDIHRHRMAPQVHERVSRAIADGQLRVIAGRIVDAKPIANGFVAILQRRNSQVAEEFRVTRIYDCAGVIADPEKSSNPLIQSLLASGMARPDPLHIGIDVSPEGALISNDGTREDRIYAVGPLTRGRFLEIEAIPDIRVQCQRLATALLDLPGRFRAA